MSLSMPRMAHYMAPVPLKRKRDRSAELKTDPAKRAYLRIPDEAKLWFQDFHAYQALVHGKTLAHNIRRAKHLVPELFGLVAPDTFRRWHDGGARDLGGRPPVELPPFALSRLANLTHAVASRLSLSVPTWQHVYRRVLESVNSCSCASSTCAIVSKSRRIAHGTWMRRLCALSQQASVGGAKKAEPAHVFASRAFVTVALTANKRGGMWTQIVYEEKSDRVLTGQRSLASSCPIPRRTGSRKRHPRT